MKRRRDSISGIGRLAFTMVEVVIALVFVSIALMALLRLQLGTIALERRAEMMTLATQVGQAKLAEIQATGFPPLGQSSGSSNQGGHILNWQTRVTAQPALTKNLLDRDGLRQLSVEVTWRQGRQRASLHLESAVANRRLR